MTVLFLEFAGSDPGATSSDFIHVVDCVYTAEHRQGPSREHAVRTQLLWPGVMLGSSRGDAKP